jgi:protoporphyrinogen oxidase
VFRTGLLDRSDSGDIGWATVPLAQLHGANAARALDAAGVETVLGAAVGSIDRFPSGSFTIVCGATRTAVDSVVVATPPRVAATLGAFDADVAERLGTSPIVNVHLVLDRRVTDLGMAACVDSPIQFLFDRTASSGIVAGQCIAISLSAADGYIASGASELVALFTQALGDVLPAARRATVVDAVVTRERAATFRAAPGVRTLRPGTGTEVPGLFLAGAWCDTGWPATMEGAVRSGREAAVQALARSARGGAGHRLDRPRPLQGART